MTPGDAGGLCVEVAGLEGALLSFPRQSACPLNNGFTLGHLGCPLLSPTHTLASPLAVLLQGLYVCPLTLGPLCFPPPR